MGRDFETRRLAAILNIETRDVQERYSYDQGQIHGQCLVSPDGIRVEWRFETLTDAPPENDAEWMLTEIVFTTGNDEEGGVTLDRIGEFTGDEWAAAVDFNAPSVVRSLAARACYCLAVADEASWESLEYRLSDHEKLELRLSLRREFWPKTWLDEEETHMVL